MEPSKDDEEIEDEAFRVKLRAAISRLKQCSHVTVKRVVFVPVVDSDTNDSDSSGTEEED